MRLTIFFLPLYLSEHLWEVVDVGGAQRLRLESFGLQQVLGNVRSVDEHAVQRPLLVPVCLEHDLRKKKKPPQKQGHFVKSVTSFNL